MKYIYPVRLERDEDGRYVAVARDVPEAVTDGSSRAEALAEMSDALGAALGGYSLENRPIPEPSSRESDEHLVPIAPLVAAKLSLRKAMQAENIANTELARRLNVSEGAVRRLVDLDHASRIDRVSAALTAIGQTLIVEDMHDSAA